MVKLLEKANKLVKCEHKEAMKIFTKYILRRVDLFPKKKILTLAAAKKILVEFTPEGSWELTAREAGYVQGLQQSIELLELLIYEETN